MSFIPERVVAQSVKIRHYLLLLAVALLPFSIAGVNVSIILATVITLILSIEAGSATLRSIVKNPVVILLFLYYLLLGIGLLYSQNVDRGFKILEGYLIFPTIIVLFGSGISTASASESETSKQNRNYSIVFVTSITLATVYCLGWAFYNNILERGLFGGFNHWFFTYKLLVKPLHFQPIYFAMYVLVAMCLIVDLLRNKTIGKYVLVLNGLFLLGFLILLSARTQIALFLGLFGLGVILYFFKEGKKAFMKLFVLIVLIGIVGFGMSQNKIVSQRFTELFEKDQSKVHFAGTSVRMQKWESSITLISQNLWYGVGTGDDETELINQFIKDDFSLGVQRKYNSHNQFLTVLIRHGIIGFLIFGSMLFFLLRIGLKEKNWIMIFILLVSIGSMFTESILERNKGMMLFCFFSLLFADHRRPLINQK